MAEGKAIERNQRMVLGFVQTHMGPVMDFVESQADLQRRQEYFASAATVDRDRVGYHVAFIDLMADIAFRNDHTRTVVRRMFPLRMLHRNLQTRRTLDQLRGVCPRVRAYRSRELAALRAFACRGPVLTHNGARRAYWRLLTVRVCGLASDDVLLMPVQNVYMRRDVRGWVRAENAEDSSALWQSLFDWAAALLDRASFMVSDQAAVIVDGCVRLVALHCALAPGSSHSVGGDARSVLPFFEGAVHLLPLIPSLVDEHVSSWMRHVWIGFRRCVDTVVRQLVSPPSDPWIADLASKPLMAAAASLLSSVRERAYVPSRPVPSRARVPAVEACVC